MPVVVTPIFAGLLALLYLALSVRVINSRHAEQIALGDKGNRALQRRIRVHSNFAEYTPFALLLILILELQGAWTWLTAGLGLFLLIGRCLHAYGVSQDPEPLKFRTTGTAITFGVLGTAAFATLLIPLLSL
ncbi:MAPEG family protein [Roseibium sp.]|uniref:MAPEG family protein n=1 Tax=Roseibium sp. TaxID=1936156 RepID=UPI003B527B49